MSDLIRDAPIGQLIRLVTRGKYLKYPEEEEGWKCPNYYKDSDHKEKAIADYDDQVKREDLPTQTEPTVEEGEPPLEEVESAPPKEEIEVPRDDASSSASSDHGQARMEKIATHHDDFNPHLEKIRTVRTTTGMERVGTRTALSQSRTRADLEQAFTQASMARQPTAPIVPAVLDDGTILVDWYDTDDPANPQNWSLRKKGFVTFQIWYGTQYI
jgi:DHA1 family multidrug resistance protein-like MFS transporter